jgi:CRP-like cAMP-binding protein
VDGEADVVREEEGIERAIGSLSAGELYGEVAIMRDEPRSASVRAKTDVTLLTLDREAFKNLIAQSMEITPDFDQVVRSRLGARAGG